MPQAQGSRHSLSFIAESTYGTTPAGNTTEIRNTGTTLALSKDAFTSEEIRNDRQIVDSRHGLRRVEGSVDIELTYGVFDVWLEALLGGAWTSNVLNAGTTVRSFTIERAHADVAQYMLFTGCMINSLSLDIQPGQLVTGSFGILGRDMTISGTPRTVTAAPTSRAFDAVSGAILEGGASSTIISSLQINIDNGLSPAFVIGSNVTPQILLGQSNVTGSARVWFENATLLNKFINETESAIQVTLDNSASSGQGGDLVFLLPRIKYNGGDIEVQNAADGLFIDLPFQALRDSVTGTNVRITRTPQP